MSSSLTNTGLTIENNNSETLINSGFIEIRRSTGAPALAFYRSGGKWVIDHDSDDNLEFWYD